MGMWPAPNGPLLDQDSIKYATSNYDLHNSEEVYRKLKFSPLPGGAPVFPIRTFAPENTYFELTNEENCKGIGKTYEVNRKKPKVIKFLNDFKSRYSNHFQKHLNQTENFLNDTKNIWNVCTAYLAGFSDGRQFKKLKLPDKGIANKTGLLKDCKFYKELELFEIRLADLEGEIVRLTTSNLVIKLFDTFDKILLAERSNLPHTKMMMLSAGYRDITSLLLYAKLAFEKIIVPYPKYSSLCIFELVKNRGAPKLNATEEDYTVNIFFNDQVIISINYSLFKKEMLWLTMDIDEVSDFCGFTDYTSLYFKIAAILLFIVFLAIGLYIMNLWRAMHSQDAAIYKKDEGDTNLNKNLINNEEVN